MLRSFAIKCTHGLWNWFFQMTDFPDSHFWSKWWWWAVGQRKQKGRKLICNDYSVPDCMLTHLPVMSFSPHVKLQERNASLVCFTWGNKALRSDWLSFTAGKWLNANLWLFHSKAQGGPLYVLLLVGPLRTHFCYVYLSLVIWTFPPPPPTHRSSKNSA